MKKTLATHAVALLTETAGYFHMSVDGQYYLREGYMFLPQDLIIRIKQWEAQCSTSE